MVGVSNPQLGHSLELGKGEFDRVQKRAGGRADKPLGFKSRAGF